MAPRKKVEPPQSGNIISSLINLGGVPLLTAIIILVGFYYTTNATLSRYGEDIKTIKTTVDAKVETDTTARTKIREDFLSSQVKTAEGIGKLDTRLAVAEEQQKNANASLSKISDTLEKISNSGLSGRR